MVSPLWGPAYPTGSGIYACELSKRLAVLGHDVHVFTSDTGHFNGYQYPEGMTIHRLKSYGLMWEMNPLSNPFVSLVREDFDIVHVHSYIFLMSNLAALASMFRNFSYVLNFHGGLDLMNDCGSLSSRVWIKDHVYDRTIGRRTVRLADKVLTVCRKDIPSIKKKFGVDAQYIPNAVCTDHFAYDEDKDDTVLYVGKLERWKGAKDLLDIFSSIHRQRPGTKFKVIGNGSMLPDIASSDLPIEVTGFVPHEAIAEHYQKASITILPSYMEGTPTTCIESLACGTPVVATNVGDTKDVVRDGQTGFLHEPGEIEDMAMSALTILEDNGIRKAMGLQGRQLVELEFSYESVTSQTMNVYKNLLNGTDDEFDGQDVDSVQNFSIFRDGPYTDIANNETKQVNFISSHFKKKDF